MYKRTSRPAERYQPIFSKTPFYAGPEEGSSNLCTAFVRIVKVVSASNVREDVGLKESKYWCRDARGRKVVLGRPAVSTY